ncbi:MAG TPA: CarD family transcriptional regulator, partial [Thermomicrobiales bacterium]|nr:CarD family transcriptional regulator [Thermomicrobiales bacterium]
SGVVHLILAAEELERETRIVRVGERLDIDDLLRWALRVGYRSVPLVQEPGEIARRGGIIDLFPPDFALPVRLDLFGDEVETIRSFDPGTQRSTDRLRDVRLLPPAALPLWRLSEAAAALHGLPIADLRPEVAAEWRRMLDQMEANATPASVDLFAPYLLRRPATLVDYFAPGDLVVIDEPDAVALAATQLTSQASELEAAFVANGELPPGLRSPIAAWPEVAATLDRLGSLRFGAAGDLALSEQAAPIADAPNYAGRLADAVDDVRARLGDGWRISIATDQVDRLTEIFESNDVFPHREKRRGGGAPAPPLAPGVLEIRDAEIDGGWSLPGEKLLVLSDLELFGFRKQARRLGRRPGAPDAEAFARGLQPGEHVVHIDHGVARFTGLVRLETNGVEREYMLLEYAKGDRLYVPVDQSDRVSRYSGGGVEPSLTRLGSGEWLQVKRRVRRAVREMAFELIQLYAVRETAQGHAFSADSTWDLELAESFAYLE